MDRVADMELSVIIVNYRTPDLVRDCLASLALERASSKFEALVVDNASGDGSAMQIRSLVEGNGWDQWVRVLESPVNGGFSAGNNIGIRASPGRSVLLLNSDTIVRPGAVRELLAAAAANPGAGLISPRLEWLDGRAQVSVFRWVRPATELVRAARTGMVTRLFHQASPAVGVFDHPVEADWVSFAAVLLRSELIASIGLMDEGYFMYYEDIDYCRRAVKAGWRVLHWPQARVVHLRGGTSPVKSLQQMNRRRPAYFYRSRARYYAKFYGRSGLWRANVYWMLGRGISLVREMIERKPRASCEAEWRDNWRYARDPLRPHVRRVSTR